MIYNVKNYYRSNISMRNIYYNRKPLPPGYQADRLTSDFIDEQHCHIW